jgi:cytidylate kinase
MNEDIETINRMSAITISREYGSGGGEIAARLARRLGWQLIDHAIVERVASEIGMSTQEAEARDERTGGILSRALNSIQHLDPTLMAYTPSAAFLSDEEVYRNTLNQVVRAGVARGHVVIVGRGAQVILAQRRDVLHIRIIAALKQRVAYVMQREGVDQATAHSRIQVKEHDRRRYLETEYQQKPEDFHPPVA